MDSSHYPDSGARNDALCRAAARDRGHFAKNADPDTAKPRARRLGAAHCSSRCASEGGVLSHEIGRTLIEPLHALCRWSEKHLAELQANRARAKQVVLE